MSEHDTEVAPTPVQTGTKRSQESSDGPVNKRPHIDIDDNILAVKILIPSGAVGAIIGKGGEGMKTLTNEYNIRMHFSKNSETYPGTSERVCTLRGRSANVLSVVFKIMECIKEKCDGVRSNDGYDLRGVSRGSEIKIVMPNTSAGKVIGKAGANINDVRDSFGCQIQVMPNAGSPEAKYTLERVATLAHEDLNQLLPAVGRVLEKIASDPNHSSEISKDDVFNNTAKSGGGFSSGSQSSGSHYGGQSNFGQQLYGSNQYGYQSNNNNGMSGGGGPITDPVAFLDNLRSQLRSSGFSEGTASEIMQAMNVLAKYNSVSLAFSLTAATMNQMRSDGGRPAFCVSGVDMKLENTLLLDVVKNRCPTAKEGDENFAASQLVERSVTDEAIELECPDVLIGAVIGPRAKTLQDIQQHSSCRVQVHKRDSQPDVPSGSRLICITGEEDNMKTCRLMIERVINDAQDRRNAKAVP